MKIDRGILAANDQNMGDFGDPDKLESSIKHLADVIDNNDNNTTSNGGRITTLETDNTSNKNRISTLETDNTSNKSRITTNENNIAYDEARLDNLLRNTQQASEVVDARMKANGTTFPLLKDRLNNTDEQLADIVYFPYQFGAIGDGVADDTDSLQKCLDAKGNIDFGNYTYKVTSKLTYSGENTRLYSKGAKFICTEELNDAVFSIESKKVEIDGISIQGDSTKNTGGIQFVDTTNTSVIKNCSVTNLGWWGIYNAGTVIKCYLEDCTMIGGSSSGHGAIFSGRDNVVLDENTIYCGGGDGLDHAIYCGGSQHTNIKIRKNYLFQKENATTGPLLACYLSTPVADVGHSNVIIENNVMDYRNHINEARAAVVLNVQDSVFSQNIVYGSSNAGGASLWLNDCRNLKLLNNEYNISRLNITIAQNCYFDNEKINVEVRLNGSNVDDVYNLFFKNCVGNPLSKQYFRLYNKSHDIYVENCTFINMSTYLASYNIDTSSYNLFIRNCFYKNVNDYAIYVNGPIKVMVEGNKILNDNPNNTISRGITFKTSNPNTGSIVKDNFVQGTVLNDYEITTAADLIKINNIGKNNTVVS